MTMLPAPEIDTNLSTLLHQHQHHHQLLVFLQGGGVLYGGGYAFLDHNTIMINRAHGYEYQTTTNCAASDLASSNPMAEDESRTNSLNDAVSTSKDNNNNTNNSNDDSWLTLGLGSHVVPAPTTVRHDESQYSEQATDRHRRPPGELIELDLLPGSRSSGAPPPPQLPLGSILHMPEFRAPSRPVLHSFGSSNMFFQHQLQQAAGSSSTASFPHHHHHHHHPHQEVGWSFRPVKDKNIAAVGSPSPSSSNLPFGSYFARPFHVQDVAGPPSSDFRVVDPPRRPHSGIWFLLQASQNQVKEPALPQIPKSYLRIKDGRMTVRLLIKYLANKLRVDSESEIEIRCRGQELEPFLTLQHVRDNIWSPSSRDAPPITLLPHPASSSTADHLMVLHYARTPTYLPTTTS